MANKIGDLSDRIGFLSKNVSFKNLGTKISTTRRPFHPDEEEAIPGDLNGDGVVNEADEAIFLAAYGSCDGDPNFNPDADFDEDGCITINDYRIFRSYV